MITAIIVALFAAVVVADFLPFTKKIGTKDKVVYGAIMIVSFSVLILYTFDIPVPSPTAPITDLIDALFPALNP